MMGLLRNRRGSILIDLMITVVILGILAAAAVPIYRLQVNRAKISEADDGLVLIHRALREFYSTYNRYPKSSNFTAVTELGIGVTTRDLDGKYFSADKFTYKSDDGETYELRVIGSGANAGINRKMDEDGKVASF